MNVSHETMPAPGIHRDATDIFVPASFCGYVSAAGKPGQPGIVLHIGCEEPTKDAHDHYAAFVFLGFLMILIGVFGVALLRGR